MTLDSRLSTLDFYVVGGTVPVGSAAYVKRRADFELFEALQRGEFCYILTSRQMGKSSLMARTAARLREREVAAAVIDLTSIGHDLDREQWYYSLLIGLGTALRMRPKLRSFWDENEDLPPLQRWIEALRYVLQERPEERLVIFIDEIDTVLALPFKSGEFFAGIRSCYNRRSEDPEFERLTFCLLGVANPSDLITDARLTPFNVGRRIELHDFAADEASVLEHGLGDEEIVGGAVLERVLYWTGGHPYLTQRLCQGVVESGEVISPALVDRLCDELFLSSRAREQDDNLIFVRDRLLNVQVAKEGNEGGTAGVGATQEHRGEELAALLDLYRRIRSGQRVADDKAVRLIGVLKLAGIVRSEAGRLWVRNRIYSHVFDGGWITAHLPGAEIRRQRAAYRRGVLRTVLASAAVLTPTLLFAAIAVFQWRQAASQRNLAQAATARATSQRNRAEDLLYAADMNLVSQAFSRGEYARIPKYLNDHLPGNGLDRRGFEWWYYWGQMHQDVKTVQASETSVVLNVALTLDGETVATGDGAGRIVLWNAGTLARKRTIETGQGGIRQLMASPRNPHWLAASGDDGTIRIWDTSTGRQVRRAPVNGPDDSGPAHAAIALAFSADGTRLAYNLVVGRSRLPIYASRIWEVDTGRLSEWRFGTNSAGEAAAFVLGDRYVLTGDDKYRLVLLDAVTMKPARTIQVAGGCRPTAISALPGGERALVGQIDGAVRLLDLRTGGLRTLIRANGMRAGGVCVSPDGRSAAVANWDSVLRLAQLGAKSEALTIPGHVSRATGVCFSRDGRRFYSTGDASLKVWDLSRLRANPERRDAVRIGEAPNGFCPGFTRFGSLYQTSPSPEHRQVFLYRDGISGISAFPCPFGCSLAVLSADEKLLAIGSEEGRVTVWDVAARIKRADFAADDRKFGIAHVRFSADNSLLAVTSGDPGRAVVWDIRSLANVRRLACLEHPNAAEDAAFLGSSNVLAVATWPGALYLWDFRKSPNPDYRTLERLRPHSGSVNGVIFSPDGRTLATCGEDRTVRLWNVMTRREMVTFQNLPGDVSDLSFSPDGRALMARVGRKIWVWQTPPPEQGAR